MKRYKQILIGVSFIIAIVLFIWGYNFLKGKDVFNKQTVYYAKYHKVSGLDVSNPVLINGMRIGQVSKIYFSPDMSGDLIVEITTHNKFPVPDNTIAKIASADLMGSKEIELKLGNSKTTAKDGDTLATDIEADLKDEVNAQVQPIKRKAEALLGSIDTLVTVFQTIFNESARQNLRESFNNINRSLSHIESATGSLDTLMNTEGARVSTILQNIESLSYTLSNNKDQLAAIIDNFEMISDSLAKSDVRGTFTHINQTLSGLEITLGKINNGEGSMGMLINDDSLYIELDKSARELNLLLKDIRENPKRYVKFSVF